MVDIVVLDVVEVWLSLAGRSDPSWLSVRVLPGTLVLVVFTVVPAAPVGKSLR